jgi:hypothetical protein
MVIDPEELGARLTAATMGIDAFERHSARGAGLLDEEGLVPICLGGALIRRRRYESWDEIRADLAALGTDAAKLPSGPRAVFMRGMLASLQVAVRLFCGASPSFEEKVRDLVGAPTGAVDPAIIDDIRGRLDLLLRQQGLIRGDLADRVRAWEEDEAVERGQLHDAFGSLMAEAKARTDALIFDTGDYDMTLHLVGNVAFTARCNFDQGRMELNVDIPVTRAGLKHLVCHEVYPGHSTQLLYTFAKVKAGESHAEALLCTANAVTGCVQEGIGDQGIELLGWIEDRNDEIHLALQGLRSAAQTSAAWNLMAEGHPASAVADYLRHTAIGQEAWIKGRLRRAAHPFRGPFIASYWAGNESVRRVRESVPEARRAAFIAYLFGKAHSPESLAMFPARLPKESDREMEHAARRRGARSGMEGRRLS